MALYATSRGGLGGGGGGGSSPSGVVTVDLYDPIDTTLPTTAPYIIDGVTLVTGTTVLFSNLATGNNEVYQATVSGSTITWTVQSIFNNSASPTSGTLVVITEGSSFANQVGLFNGTIWVFNNAVRYFIGTNYFEQDGLAVSTLADNTTAGTVFSLAYAGSQNIIVDYSVIRAGAKETGSIFLTTNGSVVGISSEYSSTAPTGVTFSSIISGSNLILQYTTTSTGSSGTMMYSLKRWSDTAGGPGGPPSYSGGSSLIAAAGANENIQINNAGTLGASSNFSYDMTNNLLLMGGKQISTLNVTTFLDNQSSPALMFSMPATFNSVFIRYTAIRGTNVRSGELQIATDGSINISSDEYFTESSPTGMTFSVTLSGGNIDINYTTTSTGIGGVYKYSFERW
jgi:hypothetical protein